MRQNEWRAERKTGLELPPNYQWFKCSGCGHRIASTEKPGIDCWECTDKAGKTSKGGNSE